MTVSMQQLPGGGGGAGGGSLSGGGGGLGGTATGFGYASAGLDLIGGLFGFLAGGEIAGAAESRGRMVQFEAEADAQRYNEQAESFKARQKLAFIKSGVQLTGSPLEILAETARVTRENISAIRARGRAGAFDFEMEAVGARQRGRGALIGGVKGAASSLLMTEYFRGRHG